MNRINIPADKDKIPDHLKQFDIVQIISVDGISFLSGPKNTAVSPHGFWSVIGIIAGEVLISKGGALVKAPIACIKKVASHKAGWEKFDGRKEGEEGQHSGPGGESGRSDQVSS
jgi:hypothetical protein